MHPARVPFHKWDARRLPGVIFAWRLGQAREFGRASVRRARHGAASGDGFVADVLETRDVVVALDASGIERLWQYRERQAEGFDAWGIVHKLDVSVPLETLAACARELQTVIAEFPKVKEFGIFGHLADGNIHVEILGPPAEEIDVDTAVLECIARYGGSISAEQREGQGNGR